MNFLINKLTNVVRTFMYALAEQLHRLSHGSLTPNMLTWVGLIAHIPIAFLIATQQSQLAGLLLIVFGLFDALDGALARVQHKTGNAGMLLDASTDRFKEVMLYIGAGYAISDTTSPHNVVWAIAACGASLCVSYIKAKGETAMKDTNLNPNEINRLFSDGIFRFQVRILLLVIGLLANQLLPVIIIISLGSGLTALSRLIKIKQKLHVQD